MKAAAARLNGRSVSSSKSGNEMSQARGRGDIPHGRPWSLKSDALNGPSPETGLRRSRLSDLGGVPTHATIGQTRGSDPTSELGTDNHIELQIVANGALVLNHTFGDTEQADLEAGQANLYVIPAPVSFTRASPRAAVDHRNTAFLRTFMTPPHHRRDPDRPQPRVDGAGVITRRGPHRPRGGTPPPPAQRSPS